MNIIDSKKNKKQNYLNMIIFILYHLTLYYNYYQHIYLIIHIKLALGPKKGSHGIGQTFVNSYVIKLRVN